MGREGAAGGDCWGDGEKRKAIDDFYQKIITTFVAQGICIELKI